MTRKIFIAQAKERKQHKNQTPSSVQEGTLSGSSAIIDKAAEDDNDKTAKRLTRRQRLRVTHAATSERTPSSA